MLSVSLQSCSTANVERSAAAVEPGVGREYKRRNVEVRGAKEAEEAEGKSR